MDNLPGDFWELMTRDFAGILTPELEGVFLDSAKELLQATPTIGVDWSLVNQSAADWSRGHWLAGGMGGTQYQYPTGLAVLFSERRKQELAKLIPAYFEQGWTMGQLRERMDALFGPIWGEMVASTEVTRAAVQGERAVVEAAKLEGLAMVEVWQTSNDEMVCPICGPRHGKHEGDGWTQGDGPPAHPRCRCWTTHELPPMEAQP